MNGLILVNKPRGVVSFSVTDRIRRLLGVKKCGHLGTLDPMADGLLPILVGKATKLFPFLLDLDKSYSTTVLLGIETSSGDIDGEVIKRTPLRELTEEKIRESFNQLTGKLLLSPPGWSAKKIKGKPAYKLARKGIKLELKPQAMTIKALRLERIELPYLTASLVVSSGTYIRSWAIELGRKLGVGAHIVALTRTSIGPYKLDDAIELDRLEKLALTKRGEIPIISINNLLSFMPAVKVTRGYEKAVANGMILPEDKLIPDTGIKPDTMTRLLSHKGEILAVINWRPDEKRLYSYRRVIKTASEITTQNSK